MSHDVFISHSSLDKAAADAVCHGLEAHGIRCWIAPRDQVAGQPYGEQITDAIHAAKAMVLVFSDNVNKSQAVLNEINIAANANVTIVPFRIAAVEFNPELNYYLGRTHWLDAFPHPVHAYIATLADTVRRNLAPSDAAPPPPAAPPPVKKSGARTLVIGGAVTGGLVLLVLVVAVVGLLLRAPPQQTASASALSAPGADTTPIRPANPQQVAEFESVVMPNGPPLSLAGATVINTAQLADKIKAHDAGQIHLWLIDARGCSTEPTLPTADCMAPNTLDQLKSEIPSKTMQLIFFCLDGSCPESYKSAQAAIAAGYTNVLWYRGGVNAWAAAGLPTVSHTP
ncbi:MAG: TIR domain-containing protein [Caulobacterales bacterium]